jgi:hypothetical protein
VELPTVRSTARVRERTAGVDECETEERHDHMSPFSMAQRVIVHGGDSRGRAGCGRMGSFVSRETFGSGSV